MLSLQRNAQPPLPALERLGKLYHMLLDSIPSSVLLIDGAQRVVSVNRNFLAQSRVAEADVLGKQVEDVFPAVISQQIGLRTRVTEVFRTGQAIRGERLTYRAPGIPTRAYYYSLIPFVWNHRAENVMLLMEDVTEQVRLGEEARRVERHLASVVECASEVMVSTDLDGRILTWNTAAIRLTGFDESDVKGRPLPSICAEAQRPALARTLKQILSGDQPVSVEAELISRAGPLIPVAWVVSAMPDTHGKPTGLVAVGRDLTERRQFESQLIRSEKLAALGVLAGGIAHEIRNPLAVVSSAAQLLLDAPLDPPTRRVCEEKIQQNVQRASGVIENLLRFARQSDRGERLPLDLTVVARDAAELTANQFKLSRVELGTEFPVSAVLMRGNAGLLQQLVMNLLLNAANAMPDTGGRVTLRVSIQAPNVVLQVADTGCGIPTADLPKVFDPFFTTMPVGKGTGLGLSICYSIAQQHGGGIDISSEPSWGTVVTVRLPLDTPSGTGAERS